MCTNKKENKKQMFQSILDSLQCLTMVNIKKLWFTKSYFWMWQKCVYECVLSEFAVFSCNISSMWLLGNQENCYVSFLFHGLCCFCENRCERSVCYRFVWEEFLGLCHKSRFGSHAGRMFSIVNHGGQFWRASRSPALAHWGH